MDQTQEVQTERRRQTAKQPAGAFAFYWSHLNTHVYSIVDFDWSIGFVPLHATELEAVGIRLVMGGKVVVVENPDAEHSRVNAGTQEEDGDEARHLVEKR